MTDHGLLAVCVTVLLAAFAGIWRLASIAARLEAESKILAERVSAVAAALELLKAIPDHERRISAIEAWMPGISNAQHAQHTTIALLLRDMHSIKPPRQGSIHDE